MNKAIVTGATGFIGSLFVKTLIDNNVSVLALGRKSKDEILGAKRELLANAEYLQIDMSDIKNLPQRLEECEWNSSGSCVFFNLAWGGDGNLSDLNVKAQLNNVEWSVDAYRVANKLNCEKFVHIGTMEEAFTNKYLRLDHHVNSEYNRHIIYSEAKIISKNMLKLESRKLKTSLIFANNSHVMGPNDSKDSFLQVTLQKLINKEPLVFSSGHQIFDVISVHDCAYAYYLIGEKGRPCGDYWVGSGEARALREYVEIMARLYPSNQELQFGKMPYNDISLQLEDFSIASLQADTGFKPRYTYEDTVHELHGKLVSGTKN